MKNYFRFFAAVSIILLACSCARKPAFEWQAVGSPRFTPGEMDKISLFVDNGTPYVAFDDYTSSDKAAVMRFDGKAWGMAGTQGFSEGSAGYITLYVNKGMPYVGYDEVPEDGRHFVFPKAMKYDGTAWAPLSEDELPNSAMGSSLYVCDDGAYMLSSEKGILKLSGSKWEAVGDEPFSKNTADFASLRVNAGVPYVIFSDTGGTKKAVVKKMENGKWTVVGNGGISQGEVCATSICFDGATPYAAFVDKGNSGNACAMRYNGTAWEPLGKPGFSKGQSYYTTLCVDKGALYLAYLDASLQANALKFNGKEWESIGTGLPKGELSYYTMTVSGSIPYIAFCQADKNGKDPKATVMALRPVK